MTLHTFQTYRLVQADLENYLKELFSSDIACEVSSFLIILLSGSHFPLFTVDALRYLLDLHIQRQTPFVLCFLIQPDEFEGEVSRSIKQ